MKSYHGNRKNVKKTLQDSIFNIIFRDTHLKKEGESIKTRLLL